MSNYTTTIICDFDDTLAFTHNRDWANAVPNLPLIEKLNNLYDQGWTIIVLTARGNLSCKTREEADVKYRHQIETWLSDNNVKYTELSFAKRLAALYIDDKNLRPDEFVEKFKQEPLEGGLSGATIIHDHFNNSVLKTAVNTPSVVEWFNYAKSYVNVPKINTVIGNTISMEYIEHHKELFELKTAMLILHKFIKTKPIYSQKENKLKYVERCVSRITDDLSFEDINRIETLLLETLITTEISFSHGDFSISNILVDSTGKHYLIDPISAPDLLSSWELDYSKLHLSLETDFRLLTRNCIIHQIGHLCRMLSYSKKKDIKIYNKQKQQLLDRLKYVKSIIILKAKTNVF
jgi:capsule biosynthesis phosphatase